MVTSLLITEAESRLKLIVLSPYAKSIRSLAWKNSKLTIQSAFSTEFMHTIFPPWQSSVSSGPDIFYRYTSEQGCGWYMSNSLGSHLTLESQSEIKGWPVRKGRMEERHTHRNVTKLRHSKEGAHGSIKAQIKFSHQHTWVSAYSLLFFCTAFSICSWKYVGPQACPIFLISFKLWEATCCVLKNQLLIRSPRKLDGSHYY